MPILKYFPRTAFERLKKLPLKASSRATLFADMCRVNTLYMIKRAGSGHIGTSFSAMEIIVWLYLNRDIGNLNTKGPHSLFFSSKGHDVPAHYSVMLALGLLDFDLIHKLRRLGGLPGHPDVGTDNIVTNTGSLGMGISKAKGLLKAADLDGRELKTVFVLTGDGELQEGQFWESLVSAANNKEGRLTVIVDHNKIQSDTLIRVVNDLGDLGAKLNSFGWHVQRCDGHDVEAFAKCVEECIVTGDKPSVILADTVKGKGVSFMEPKGNESINTLYGYHSGAPSDKEHSSAVVEIMERLSVNLKDFGSNLEDLGPIEEYEASSTSPGGYKQKLVEAYSKALVEVATGHSDVVVLDADLMLDCGLIPFRSKFPDRFIECGIAEQDMVSQAGGLALAGKVPIVHSFSCFLSTRPNEQIYNNSTEKTKIIYTAPLSGITPGGPGHSHQSVRDISAVGGIPGLVLVAPGTEKEVSRVLEYCLDPRNESSFFLRLASVPCEIPFRDSFDRGLVAGQGEAIREGSHGVVVGYGPVMLTQAWHCAERLERECGLSLKILNFPWLNIIDAEWFAKQVAGYSYLFTLDDHYKKGGQGEMIAAASSTFGGLKIHSFGLSSIPECGSNDEVLRHHGLDASSLFSSIKSMLATQP